MDKRDIIIIGGSAGSVPAMVEMVKGLPADLPAAVFVVLHVSPYTPSLLPQILTRAGKPPAAHAKDGEPFYRGRIYIAPPDQHLLLEKGRILVKKGPKENRFRPSIDTLFRSAAYSYGPRVIGVVLSGLLDDGTSGLWAVKRLGGLGIIQEPEEAICPSMPANVLEYVEVDHILPVADIAKLLPRLAREAAPQGARLSANERDQMEAEILIAAQKNAFLMGVLNMGRPVPLTCPECNGALVEMTEGNIVRYRCHTGHSFTQSALLSGVYKTVEESMWQAVRGLEEVIILLQETARQFEMSGNLYKAQEFRSKAEETQKKSVALREQIFLLEPASKKLSGNGEEGNE